MMAVFEQRVFHGLRMADEQAAIETVLFLGDPLATLVLPIKTIAEESYTMEVRRASRWYSFR